MKKFTALIALTFLTSLSLGACTWWGDDGVPAQVEQSEDIGVNIKVNEPEAEKPSEDVGVNIQVN